VKWYITLEDRQLSVFLLLLSLMQAVRRGNRRSCLVKLPMHSSSGSKAPAAAGLHHAVLFC
jgi:hypothetical protein